MSTTVGSGSFSRSSPGIYDAVRHISSRAAAERIGLPVKRRGEKAWTCCPFHGEKEASLCLYEDPARGWVCFGCRRGGDAVTLYSEYYHTTRFDAAKQLASDFGIAVPEDASVKRKPVERQPTAHNLRRALKKHRNREYARLCDAVHAANSGLEHYHDDSSDSEPSAWDDPRFVNALRARSVAETQLDWLHTATVPELAQHYSITGNK